MAAAPLLAKRRYALWHSLPQSVLVPNGTGVRTGRGGAVTTQPHCGPRRQSPLCGSPAQLRGWTGTGSAPTG